MRIGLLQSDQAGGMRAVLEIAIAINNEYRTAALNYKYYACRLQAAQRLERGLNIALALTSSGAVAAWSIWKGGVGASAWQVLGGATAVVGLVRPFLNSPSEISRLSELVVGYATIRYDMKSVVEDVKASDAVSQDAWNRYCAVRARTKDLGMKDDLRPRAKLHRRCYNEVNREIPSTALWWPRGIV